jgi:sterol 14-demethylase
MNRPARVDKYSEGFTQVASDLFSKWERQSSVPLFISGSDLLLRANMTALYGPRFVDKYATELIPVIRSFERAFVQPWTRVLPLWASPSGRELSRAYKRLKQVIEAEVHMRMKDLDYWKNEGDYMSYLLTMDDKAEDFFDCYGEHLVSWLI